MGGETARDHETVGGDNRGGRTSHPALFPALGGHASYNLNPNSVGANKPVGNCSVGGIVWNDRAGRGHTWRPWAERRLRLASDHLWYGYGGAWGDRSETSSNLPGVDNYGPPAPGPHNLGVPQNWR